MKRQKMPLSNIANTVAKLHGLGILMHDNAWHPQILWYLMRNDTNSLKTIMRMQAEGRSRTADGKTGQ